ncbi:MAG: ABC transporter permease [Thermoanaerobaculia bacterium]
MLRIGLIWQLFRRAAHIQAKRMAMTVAAIAWGTLSIVLLLSFGEGLKRNFSKGSKGMGEGIIVVWPGATSKAYAGFPQGRNLKFTEDDVDLLLATIPEIGAASPELAKWGNTVTHGRKSISNRLVGVRPSYGEMRNHIPEPGGRFLDEVDERLKRRVVFLGSKTKKELFEDQDAIGQTVMINQVPFTVIGVMVKKIQMGTYMGPDEGTMAIPFSTFRALYSRRYLSDMVVKAKSPELNPLVKRRMYEILGAKMRFDPDDERTLGIWDTVESQRITQNISIGIELFLGVIGALTLLIGGVGVANIMYAVVKHRTREIGVQMALGARRSYVLGPLVVESLSLTAIGGVIGIVAGAAVVQLLAFVQSKSNSDALQFLGAPTLSLGVAATTVLLLGTIGFLAGYFPSRRAVSIQPAVALRYE